MKSLPFKHLFILRENITNLTNEINKHKTIIDSLKSKLDEYAEMESNAERDVINEMTKQGIKTQEYEGKQIQRTLRKSVKIADPTTVLNVLRDKYIMILKKLSGKTVNEIKTELVKPEQLDTKKAREYIDILIKVENITVEGTENIETEYLTIK